MLNKIIAGGLIAAVMGFSGPYVAGALSESSKPKDCTLLERSSHWGDFLGSVVSSEGFTEFWKDIFVRNFCHQYDIDLLQRKLDKVRKQIRSAFYTCNNDKAEQLVKTYHKLYIELFYLRTFVKYEGGQIVPNQSVQPELNSLFVKKKEWYGGNAAGLDEFWSLYDGFVSKYDIKRYQDCKDDVWAQLGEKWAEMKEVFKDAGDLASKVDKDKDSKDDRWKKVTQTPPGKTGGFWSGRVGMNLNDVPPKYGESFFSEIFSEEELKDIGKEVLENIPLKGTGALDDNAKAKIAELEKQGVSIHTYLDAVKNEDARYLKQVGIAEMLGEYTFLYKDVSDTIITELVNKVSELRGIIKDTYPALNKVKACSTQIRDKQCTNK